MKKLDRLIPIALIEAGKLIDKKDDKMPREYKGYISSFGASVIQSGLKAAVAFYENKTADSKQNKWKLTQAILNILKADGKVADSYDSLMKFVVSDECNSNLSKSRRDITDAATALKLAIRTFKMTEKDQDHA